MRASPVNTEAERGAPIAVLGAGSWGTALAIQLARSGRPTRLGAAMPKHCARWRRNGAMRAISPAAPFRNP